MYPIKDVGFGHVEQGKLVRFTVLPRARLMLLQRIRDGLTLPELIKLVWQPKKHEALEITPEDIDWADSGITPSSTWQLPGDDDTEPHDPTTCESCRNWKPA